MTPTEQDKMSDTGKTITTFAGIDVKKLTLDDIAAIKAYGDKRELKARESVFQFMEGQTFSANTNWQAVLDDAAEGNLLRIEQLKKQRGDK